MAMTFKQMLKERNLRLQRAAVYRQVIHHLEEFIPAEGDEPDMTIDAGDAGTVSPEVIQGFIDELQLEGLRPLEKAITSLEGTEVPEQEEPDDEAADEDEEESEEEEEGEEDGEEDAEDEMGTEDDEEEEESEDGGDSEGATEEGGGGRKEAGKAVSHTGNSRGGRRKAKAIQLRG